MCVERISLGREEPTSPKAGFKALSNHLPILLAVFSIYFGAVVVLGFPQLLEQYAEQVSWQSEIRHEAIRFPPMDKMIVDYQVSQGVLPKRNSSRPWLPRVLLGRHPIFRGEETRALGGITRGMFSSGGPFLRLSQRSGRCCRVVTMARHMG